MMRAFICAALLLIIKFDLIAQGFSQLSIPGFNHFASGIYGSGVTMFDWNEDGWDDMVVLSKDSLPAFYLNNQSGFTRVYFEGVDIQNEIKSVVFTDFDNDNLYDLSFTSFLGGCRLYRNTGNFVFEDITESSGVAHDSSLLSFGQAWADFNNDGYIDFFVCNYNFDNYVPAFDALYLNNGNLTFTDVTAEAGIVLDDDPTFCAVWTDFNNDGLPDLCVMNDRFAWRNYLYKNNGNGTFSEVGNLVGMNSFMDSMSATAGDFNNDGHEDMYITNTPLEGNFLFKNSPGGNFTNVSANQSVQVFGWCWGAAWIDYDNDTWQDLFVTSQPFAPFGFQGNHFMLRNVQAGFDVDYSAGFQGSTGSTFTVARGDINNDGFSDLITNSYAPLNTQVWLNDAVGGNYIRFRLKGVISNSCAAGARIKLFANNHAYHRQLYYGDQFLSQNSQWLNVGLGDYTRADSITVYWPSGFAETFYDLPANANYVFQEGSSLAHSILNPQNISTLCVGDSLQLSAQDGFEAYFWSTGQTTQSVTIYESADISVLGFDGLFYVPSDTLHIEFHSDPVEGILLDNPTCAGANDGSIQLVVSDSLAYPYSVLWTNGSNSSLIQELSEGTYEVNVFWSNACQSSISFNLEEPPVLHLDSVWLSSPGFHVSCPAGFTAAAAISGGTPPYSIIWRVFDDVSNELLGDFAGDTAFCIPYSQNNRVQCDIQDAFNCAASQTFYTPQILSQASPDACFRVFPNPFREQLHVSIACETFAADVYLYDALGKLVYQISSTILEGEAVIPTELLPKGNYFLVIRTESGWNTQLLSRN